MSGLSGVLTARSLTSRVLAGKVNDSKDPNSKQAKNYSPLANSVFEHGP
jgi:hypothetical protein